MSSKTVDLVDEVFRNRWRTLLSVDTLIKKVHYSLKMHSLLNNTYIIMTSDHGYHLGQFGMPWDKRLPYEFDIRVPFWISGPNITAGNVISTPILLIDIAPTLLEMAGIQPPPTMDGLSFLHLIRNNSRQMPPTEISNQPSYKTNQIANTENRENNLEMSNAKIAERRAFLIEYSGEGAEATNSQSCKDYLHNDLSSLSQCDADLDCKCQDSRNNSYVCIRKHTTENLIFCKFKDQTGFLELYRLSQDPFQLNNLANQLPDDSLSNFSRELNILSNCNGAECNSVN